jgi:hypothetical protein
MHRSSRWSLLKCDLCYLVGNRAKWSIFGSAITLFSRSSIEQSHKQAKWKQEKSTHSSPGSSAICAYLRFVFGIPQAPLVSAAQASFGAWRSGIRVCGRAPENNNLMSQDDELKRQRCAAADAEREQGNESEQNRDHARRYGGGAGKSSIIFDGSQF